MLEDGVSTTGLSFVWLYYNTFVRAGQGPRKVISAVK
jgi:hypothetical protein